MQTKMKQVNPGDQGRDDRRLHGRSRRVQSSGHHARGPRQARRAGQEVRASSSPPATPRSSPTAAAVVLMEAKGSRAPRPEADGPVHGLGGGRLRARRDGHRSGVRRSAPARERHGLKVDDIDLWEAQRGFRLAVPLRARHPRHRPREVQRQRRLHRHRPPVWHDRRAAHRPRPAGGPPARQRSPRCRHHVHRRRPGRRGPLRGLQLTLSF